MPKTPENQQLQNTVADFIRVNGGLSRVSAKWGISKSTLHRCCSTGKVTNRTAEFLRNKLTESSPAKKEQLSSLTERDIASFEKVLHVLMTVVSTLRGDAANALRHESDRA